MEPEVEFDGDITLDLPKEKAPVVDGRERFHVVPAPKEKVPPTAWPNEIQVPDYTSEDLVEMQERAKAEPERGAPKPDIESGDVSEEAMREELEERKAEEDRNRKIFKQNKIKFLWQKLFGRK